MLKEKRKVPRIKRSKSALSKLLRESRDARKMNLKEAAKLIKCSHNYLWKLETEAYSFSFRMAINIVEAYGITFHDIANAMREIKKKGG